MKRAFITLAVTCVAGIIYLVFFVATYDYSDNENFYFATDKLIDASKGFLRNIGNNDSMSFYLGKQEVYLEMQHRFNHHR